MKKIFTEAELEELGGEQERQEHLAPENGVTEPGARRSEDENFDEDLPEVFTMTEGKSMARQLRSDERASGRLLAAEVKKKKQERAATRKAEKASGKLGEEQMAMLYDEVPAEKNGWLDANMVQFLIQCDRKTEKASGKRGISALEELKEMMNDEVPAERNGLLDDSIVQFLSERERAENDGKVQLSSTKEPVKVNAKRLKSKKEFRNARVEVIDLSQDTQFIEERNAQEFKNGHLYGSRIKRDASMLRNRARVS